MHRFVAIPCEAEGQPNVVKPLIQQLTIEPDGEIFTITTPERLGLQRELPVVFLYARIKEVLSLEGESPSQIQISLNSALLDSETRTAESCTVSSESGEVGLHLSVFAVIRGSEGKSPVVGRGAPSGWAWEEYQEEDGSSNKRPEHNPVSFRNRVLSNGYARQVFSISY